MTAWPWRSNRGKALWLAYWNAGRDICLAEWDATWGLAVPTVCKLRLPPDRLSGSGCRHSDPCLQGTDRYTVPASGLQHLQATTIHLVLASSPGKIVIACHSLTRSLELDLSVCVEGTHRLDGWSQRKAPSLESLADHGQGLAPA
jgi:hypothetical protein